MSVREKSSAAKPKKTSDQAGSEKHTTEKGYKAFKNATIAPTHGLPEETQRRLLEIVSPKSQENPWPDKAVRVRNQLYIRMLLELGVRRTELLGLRIEDIKRDETGQASILVHGGRDNTSSPRTYRKTFDRLLAVNDSLANLIKNYLSKVRAKIKGAAGNPYLFVSPDGQPMSFSASECILAVLRKHPDLPKNLSATVFRATWNENFSRWCDENHLPPQEEAMIRCYQMGWRDDRSAKPFLSRTAVAERIIKQGGLPSDLVAVWSGRKPAKRSR